MLIEFCFRSATRLEPTLKMGCASSQYGEPSRDVRRQSSNMQVLSRRLSLGLRNHLSNPKLLLLGTGESGKTTLRKQIMYFCNHDAPVLPADVQDECLASLVLFAKLAVKVSLGSPFNDKRIGDDIAIALNYSMDPGSQWIQDAALTGAFKSLLSSPEIQHILADRDRSECDAKQRL